VPPVVLAEPVRSKMKEGREKAVLRVAELREQSECLHALADQVDQELLEASCGLRSFDELHFQTFAPETRGRTALSQATIR
jgi:hypothetical protein